MTTGTQDSGAFDESRLLIRPMIERCRADGEVERAVGITELFGNRDGEAQALIVRERACSRDHLRCGVDTAKLLGVREVARQAAQQMTRAASDVEYAAGRGGARHGESGGALGNLMVQPAAKAAVILACSIVKRG